MRPNARRRAAKSVLVSSCAAKPGFAGHLPDVTITVAAPHKTAYFTVSNRVLVFR
jgi:hypothetical protein